MATRKLSGARTERLRIHANVVARSIYPDIDVSRRELTFGVRFRPGALAAIACARDLERAAAEVVAAAP